MVDDVRFWRTIATDARDSQEQPRRQTIHSLPRCRYRWPDRRLPESSQLMNSVQRLMTANVETDEKSVAVGRDESKERERP